MDFQREFRKRVLIVRACGLALQMRGICLAFGGFIVVIRSKCGELISRLERYPLRSAQVYRRARCFPHSPSISQVTSSVDRANMIPVLRCEYLLTTRAYYATPKELVISN